MLSVSCAAGIISGGTFVKVVVSEMSSCGFSTFFVQEEREIEA